MESATDVICPFCICTDVTFYNLQDSLQPPQNLHLEKSAELHQVLRKILKFDTESKETFTTEICQRCHIELNHIYVFMDNIKCEGSSRGASFNKVNETFDGILEGAATGIVGNSNTSLEYLAETSKKKMNSPSIQDISMDGDEDMHRAEIEDDFTTEEYVINDAGTIIGKVEVNVCDTIQSAPNGEICDKNISSDSCLANEMLGTNVCAPFKCNQSDAIKAQKQTSSGKVLHYDQCDNRFSCKQGLSKPKRIYKCSACHKILKSFQNMQKHKLTHEVTSKKTPTVACEGTTKMKRLKELASNNGDITDFLIDNKFYEMSYEERIFTKNLTIPQPPMSNLIQSETKNNHRRFSQTLYSKYKWLTGSEVRNKLFCWICILFSEDSNPFNSYGYNNLKNIYRDLVKHEASKSHTCAILKFKLFDKRSTVKAIGNDSNECIKSHEIIRENRKMMRHLIDMTIFLSNRELAYGCDDRSGDTTYSDNQNSFKELMKFGAALNYSFERFSNSFQSSFLTGFSGTVESELVASIDAFVRQTIHDQITSAPCFLWEISETADLNCFSQMSVTFRFVHTGKVVERFFGFFDISERRGANDIFGILKNQFEHLNIRQKLIGQTYNAAAVMTGEIDELQRKVKSFAPQAFFTHYDTDQMSFVLKDACKKIKECNIFFSHALGFANFFSESTKRCDLFYAIIKKRISTDISIHWNLKLRMISTLIDYRTDLIEVFDQIHANFDKWDNVTIREAGVLKQILNDFDFMFLLHAFHLFFSLIDPALSSIQKKLFSDTTRCKAIISALLLNLKTTRNDDDRYFNFYFEFKKKIDSTTNASKKILFIEILDLLINQIEMLFQDLSSLSFLQLVDYTNFDAYSQQFPKNKLKILIDSYSELFNQEKLQRELHILYSYQTILFGDNQSISGMLGFIYEHEIVDDVPELYKLFCLVLTLFPTYTSGSNSFAVLKTSNIMLQSRKSNLSLLTIERQLVEELKQKDNFYEKIIDDFATKKMCEADLMYKYL